MEKDIFLTTEELYKIKTEELPLGEGDFSYVYSLNSDQIIKLWNSETLLKRSNYKFLKSIRQNNSTKIESEIFTFPQDLYFHMDCFIGYSAKKSIGVDTNQSTIFKFFTSRFI